MQLRAFSVKNYRSFDKEQTVLFNKDKENITLIYGPNGAGKSNLFKGMAFVSDFVKTSTKAYGQKLMYDFFALREGNELVPTSFSIEFEQDNFIFEYSFSLLDGAVKGERLRVKPVDGGIYDTVFSRNSIKSGRYDEFGFTSDLLRTTRPDALILTRGYEVNNKYSTDFFNGINKIHFLAGKQPSSQTAKAIMTKQEYRIRVLNLLKCSDLFIQDIAVSERKIVNEGVSGAGINDNVISRIESTVYNISTTHFLRNIDGKVVGTRQLDLRYHESEGTNRIFELAFPILDTLDNGNTLLIDDFDAALHTNECKFLISLFSGKTNKTNAHLIINTHREALMDEVGYKNILLFGKNSQESTIVGKISSESRDSNLGKKYTRGDFGAIPRIGDYAWK